MSGQAASTEYGLLAEFQTPEHLYQACEKVRDAGFSHWDAHSPFPIHGLDKAMGLKKSPVSLFVLVLGLSGATIGMLMQWWVATKAYPLVISGKPLFSWPAFIPIAFECGILGGAVGALLGFLSQARLPRPHHALFNASRLERVTDDAFFISIETADPNFDRESTAQLLKDLGATHVEAVAA
ncbi:MAG: DUF3341 domain-containing protein [Deltaproteobacteria bacterium]|nr:DUF3341 domain-containing protein [Deltaproteobacteria bacterium]